MAIRPEVPQEWVDRCARVLDALPQCVGEDAWVGMRWRVGRATVAHVFGGEDQRFRIVLRAEPEEVMAFESMGEPYFRAGWGTNVVGMILDDDTDWSEVDELLVASYCVQAPSRLAEQVLSAWADRNRAAGPQDV
jgi:hypothetical protein